MLSDLDRDPGSGSQAVGAPDIVGLRSIMFGPSKRLMLLSSSSSSSSSLIGAQPCGRLRRSRRLGNTAQVLVKGFAPQTSSSSNVGVALLHPGTGGGRLEGLSPSAPLEQHRGRPQRRWARPRPCHPSRRPKTAGRLLAAAGRSQGPVDEKLTERPCYHTSSCREQWRRQHPAESSHAECSAQRRPWPLQTGSRGSSTHRWRSCEW